MVAGDSQSLPQRRLSQPPLPGSGPLRKTRKKLQVIICVLLVELCERFTFFGIVCNTILFCTVKLGYDNYLAATVNLCFIGASTLSPVLVGWFAETCLGRSKVLYLCAFLHFFGTAMLPVVAFPFEDFYIDTHHMTHQLKPREQQILFYFGLLAAALGIGGIRAILCPMGAYSLQGYNQHQLLSFFNWFYWLVNLNSTVVFLGIAYIQQSVGKNLGFLIPFTSVLLALIAIHMMRNKLTYKPKKGGSLLTTLGIFLNSLKMCCLHYRHLSGDVGSWLDRAKENNGGRYSETHVENVKVLAKLFPLYGLQLLYKACITQIPSGYYIQTMNSKLHLNNLLLPIGAMNVISILPLLLLAPLIECVTTCYLSKEKTPLAPAKVISPSHHPSLSILPFQLWAMRVPPCRCWWQVSLSCRGRPTLLWSRPCLEEFCKCHPCHVSSWLLSTFCWVSQRLSSLPHVRDRIMVPIISLDEGLTSGQETSYLSIQHKLAYTVGTNFSASSSSLVGSLISFQLTPSHIRGISLHFLTLSYGGGCFLGAFLIQLVFFLSGGNFYPSMLHDGNLERFFFLLATLMAVNTYVFWSVSNRYKDLSVQGKALTSPLTDKLLHYKACLRFYDTVDCSYTNQSVESIL
ncbi:solute carrier family 15 member 5 isoform 2-T5 [Spinachia spinachia]